MVGGAGVVIIDGVGTFQEVVPVGMIFFSCLLVNVLFFLLRDGFMGCLFEYLCTLLLVMLFELSDLASCCLSSVLDWLPVNSLCLLSIWRLVAL